MSQQKYFIYKNQGLSLLEFCISVCVILLLIAATTYKAWLILAESERVTVSQVLNNIRLGLILNVADQETQGSNAAQLNQTTCLNPMSFIASPPSSYLGVLNSATLEQATLGSWYFDSDTCQLVYRWRFTYTLQNVRIRPDSSIFVLKKMGPSILSKQQRIAQFTLEAKKA